MLSTPHKQTKRVLFRELVNSEVGHNECHVVLKNKKSWNYVYN